MADTLAQNYITEPTHRDRTQGILSIILFNLILLLVLSSALPELRLGLSGFIYEPPTVGGYIQRAGAPWVFEIIIIAMFPVFLLGILTKSLQFRLNWAVISVLSMVFVAVLVIPISQAYGIKEGRAAFGHKRFIFEFFALYFMANSLDWRARDLRKIVWLFIFVAGFHSLVCLSLLYHIKFIPLPTNVVEQQGFDRYGGLFSFPGRYAVFVAMAAAMLYSLIIQAEKLSFSKLIIFTFLFILCSLGVALGQTRAVFLALGLVLMGATFLGNKSAAFFKRSLRTGVVLGCSLFFMILTQIVRAFSTRASVQALKTEETMSRGYIWPKVIAAIVGHPLGTGYDSVQAVLGEALSHSHNLYLHWGLMYGFPGLILFFYFLIKLFRAAKTLEFKQTKGIEYFVAIKWGVVVYLLAGLAESYCITNIGLLFWLFTGIMTSYLENELQRIDYST